ncbi:hypothetical protein [Alteriqipengyuania sp.]|uniref:hypothetical protein n=1 Tax=Alteriqipengyuania sp. TaxID=2800692 RepID=UPI003514BFE9
MTFLKGALLCAATLTLIIPSVSSASAQGANASQTAGTEMSPVAMLDPSAEADIPLLERPDWYSYRLRQSDPEVISSTQRLAQTKLDLVAISKRLIDGPAIGPDYEMFLGVDSTGQMHGIAIGGGFDKIISEEAGWKQIAGFAGLVMFVEGIEPIVLTLNDYDRYVPEGAKLTASGVQYFTTFTIPQKAYRAMSGLPDDAEIRFQYYTRDKKFRPLLYQDDYTDRDLGVVFTVGYLKRVTMFVSSGAMAE